MIKEEFKDRLFREISGDVLASEPLSEHSTIKIGGKADLYITPSNGEELIRLVKNAKEENIPIFITGMGSNVLFRDNGFEGIVINTARLKSMEIKKREGELVYLYTEAGVLINDLVNFSVENAFSGFECLAGIPGTVGGALSINAGTHDGAISDTLVFVNAVDRSGRLYEWPKDKIEFSYRTAKYPKTPVILSAEFALRSGDKEEIAKRINALRERRKERHPLAWPSLGSVFKNPPKGASAGKLIEEAGLMGVRVGKARISEKHANWIINEGGARSKDVEVLIHLIKEKVKDATDIVLESEIIVVGQK